MSTPTPEEIAAVLKHLTPQSKSVFIAEKAKDQDMVWLRGMAEQGAFLVPRADLDRAPYVHTRFVGTTDLSFPNVSALAGVINGADFEALDLVKSVTRARPATLAVSADFKAFLYETSMALMQSANDFRANEKPPTFSSSHNALDDSKNTADLQIHTQRMQRFGVAINATFLALLQTACACDDGKTADLLLQGTNTLGTMYSPSSVLGHVAGALPGTPAERTAARVNPMYTAMLFSAHAALSALQNHDYPLQKVVALYPRAEGEAKSKDDLKAYYGEKHSPRIPVDFIASNAMPCTPAMLTRIVEGQRPSGYRIHDVEPLAKEAHRLLSKDRTPYEDSLKLALTECDVFELQGKTSAKLAVDRLDLPLVNRLEYHINWLESLMFGGTQYQWEVNSILTNPIARNVPGKPMGPNDRFGNGSEAMVLMLMEFAARAGHGFRLYEQGPHQAALVKWSIEKDHPKVLVKMMENGLEPDRYLLLNDTAYGLAEKAGKKEAEHLMRTYLSGQKARKALNDMDLEEPAVQAAAPAMHQRSLL